MISLLSKYSHILFCWYTSIPAHIISTCGPDLKKMVTINKKVIQINQLYRNEDRSASCIEDKCSFVKSKKLFKLLLAYDLMTINCNDNLTFYQGHPRPAQTFANKIRAKMAAEFHSSLKKVEQKIQQKQFAATAANVMLPPSTLTISQSLISDSWDYNVSKYKVYFHHFAFMCMHPG